MYKLLINRDYFKEVLKEIEGANKKVYVFMYDFAWWSLNEGSEIRKIYGALKKAKSRGVRVQIIAETKRSFASMREPEIKIKKIRSERIMHSKVCIIDDKKVFIGSHNWSQRGFRHNVEISVMIESEELASKLTRYFLYWWDF